jgi:PAS domain S-box-containing protein
MNHNLEELGITLFEESGDALFLFEPETERLLEVNPMAQRLSGHTRAQLLALSIVYLFRSEVRGGMNRLRQAFHKTGVFHSQEGFFLRHLKDETWVPANVSVTRLHAEPETLGLIMVRDISERRQALNQIKQAEERLRTVVSHSPVVLFAVDPKGIFTLSEGKGLAALGLKAGEVVGRSALDMYAHLPHLVEHLRRALAGEAFTALADVDGGAGADLCFETHYSPLFDAQGNLTGTIGIATDITDRRRVEKLWASHNRVLEMIARGDALPDVLTAVCRAVESQRNGSLCSVLLLDEKKTHLRHGAAPSLPAEFNRLVDGLAVGPCVGSCGTAVFRREPVYVTDIAVDPLWADYRDLAEQFGLRACWSTPILARDGGVLGAFAVYDREARAPRETDLQLLDFFGRLAAVGIERAEAETSMRASEARYRSLIENLAQSVFLKDLDLRFVAVNKPFCESLGRAAEEILGKSDLDFFPRALAEKYRLDDRLVITEGRRLEQEEEHVKAGGNITVHVVKTPVKDDRGRVVGVQGIFWDITEQRVLEAQLRQAQKMEGIGQLAGGVAHDFNNLLTVILGNLSLMLRELPIADPGRELVVTAERAALRAAELTSQLLGFSRRSLIRPRPTSLNDAVAESIGILRRTIDPRISVQIEPHPLVWTVLADPGQINQVLMNLCINARDAMPSGGRLQLATENVFVDETYARLRVDARVGPFVRLSVSDTGHGMSPEIRTRIFEPFFTTKEPGQGTGLGLAMAFGIIKQHQGWIDCSSEPGRGTRFDIYLPRHDQIAAPTSRSSPSAPRPGRETILLVDDEIMLRSLGAAILQGYGYRVLVAEDGLEAVEAYRTRTGPIDLVVLDLTMPRLSGRDAYRQLLDIDPEVRVMFTSGYSADSLPDIDIENILGFLPKPYRPEDLATAIRNALDRKSQPLPGEQWKLQLESSSPDLGPANSACL